MSAAAHSMEQQDTSQSIVLVWATSSASTSGNFEATGTSSGAACPSFFLVHKQPPHLQEALVLRLMQNAQHLLENPENANLSGLHRWEWLQIHTHTAEKSACPSSVCSSASIAQISNDTFTTVFSAPAGLHVSTELAPRDPSSAKPPPDAEHRGQDFKVSIFATQPHQYLSKRRTAASTSIPELTPRGLGTSAEVDEREHSAGLSEWSRAKTE